MALTGSLISVGHAYIRALVELDENHPERVPHILDILNCIHPDPDYHFGIYIEEPPGDFDNGCDQSWFHCYRGVEKSIMRYADKPHDCLFYHYHDDCHLRFTFDFLNHLIVDYSEMGAWQAYLLSIAKTILPFSGVTYYTKRRLIFEHDQLKRVCPPKKDLKEKLQNIKADLSPWVKLDGSQAVVSCCYWNPWGGLKREFAIFSFLNNKVYLLDEFHKETLFKYDIGICF